MTLKIFSLRNSSHCIPFVELQTVRNKENKGIFNLKLCMENHRLTKLSHGSRRQFTSPFSILNFQCLAQSSSQPALSDSLCKIRLKYFSHRFFFLQKEYHLNFMSQGLHSVYNHLNISLVLCVYFNNSLYWCAFKKNLP